MRTISVEAPVGSGDGVATRPGARRGAAKRPTRVPAGRRSGAYAFGPMPAVSVPASFRGSAGSTTGRAPVLVASDGVSTEA